MTHTPADAALWRAQLADMPLDAIVAYLRERGWVVGASWAWRGLDALLPLTDDDALPFDASKDCRP